MNKVSLRNTGRQGWISKADIWEVIQKRQDQFKAEYDATLFQGSKESCEEFCNNKDLTIATNEVS